MKDGTVLNGAFWLNGKSEWLITNPNQPLKEFLREALQERLEFIERLTISAQALENWLNEQL